MVASSMNFTVASGKGAEKKPYRKR
jgi:hypothetical protein